jgi:hypothetical protein
MHGRRILIPKKNPTLRWGKNAFQRRRSQSYIKAVTIFLWSAPLNKDAIQRDSFPGTGNADLVPAIGRHGIFFSHPLATASLSLPYSYAMPMPTYLKNTFII